MSGYYYAMKIDCDNTGYCNAYYVTCEPDDESYCGTYTIDYDTNSGFDLVDKLMDIAEFKYY